MKTLLEISHLKGGYGRSKVLHDIDFAVHEGEIVTLLGRNGMGKTTSIKCIMGLIRPTGGSIHFAGERVDGKPSYDIARRGVGLVPEGRQIFPSLSVEENLLATAANRHGAAQPFDLGRVYQLFPRLRERRANMGNQLSGGEQQMLAIGRALMTNPKLLILDEATEGLAPLVRAEIWRVLEVLADLGLAMIIVDKNLKSLLGIASRHHVVEKGEMAWQGTSEELMRQPEVVEQFLSV